MSTDRLKDNGAPMRLEKIGFAYTDGASMQFDLTVEPGETVAIMGPSGSGKSTLLNLIAGFENPDTGRILIAGEDVTKRPPHQRPISMVFQENNLFAHLDVAANIGLGRSPGLHLSEHDRQAIDEALLRTGLSGKQARLPHALSGGERQRVALARVLVRERPILLLDEPFASLGPALRDEMLDLVSQLHRERPMTILMATHDPRDAQRLAQTLVFIEQGRVSAVGSVSDFLGGKGPASFRRYIGNRQG